MDSTENGKNYLESIFKSAERGMTEFNMPLTNEGKFEVLMYGIWLGMKALDEFGIPQNHKESLSKVNDFLVDYAKRLGIPQERKAERLFVLRDEDWEKDTKSLARSNYPQTKQYLPDYLYMCFVGSPLVLYSSFDMMRKAEQIDPTNLIDFLAIFETYYNRLVEDFSTFESDTNSHKSKASKIIEESLDASDDQGYKSVYKDFESELIERSKVKDISKLPLEEMLYMPTYTLGMLDRLAVETVHSFKILDMSGGVNSITNLMRKDLDYLQKNRKGVLEYAKPMLEKDVETRKRCVALLRAMDEDKYTESKEELESVITNGEELLNSVLKSIDSGVKFIDTVIDMKTKNNGNGSSLPSKKTSNSGCLSVLAVIIICTAFYMFL